VVGIFPNEAAVIRLGGSVAFLSTAPWGWGCGGKNQRQFVHVQETVLKTCTARDGHFSPLRIICTI
jgi:hypothetical protein